MVVNLRAYLRLCIGKGKFSEDLAVWPCLDRSVPSLCHNTQSASQKLMHCSELSQSTLSSHHKQTSFGFSSGTHELGLGELVCA